MQVRDANVWKDSEPWVRDGGVWKPVDTGFVRDAGVWKEFYSSGFDPSTPLGTFIEGGYYLGTILDGGITYALIVAPKSGGQSATYLAYGSEGGATSTTNGPANTESMATSAISHPAAEFCYSLSLNGYADWYLPAREEMTVLWGNRTFLPDSFEPAGAQTSTEYSSTQNWVRNFFNNTEVRVNKSIAYATRAVRRVKVDAS